MLDFNSGWTYPVNIETKGNDMNLDQMILDFLARGGSITKCRKGTPKDLQRMKSSGWLFGGKRTYVATMHKRQDSAKGQMFDGVIAKPMARGNRLAYDFA